MDEMFQTRIDTVAAKLNQASVDPELKLGASDALREVRADQRDVLTQDGREAFVLRYLQREAERFRADDETLDALDADEQRTKPLCTCSDSGCALKDGRLPVLVENAETLEQGLRQFRRRHRGNPVVLDDAEHALDDKVGRVMQVYDHIMISLSNGIPIDEVRALRSDDADAEGDEQAAAPDPEAAAPPAE